MCGAFFREEHLFVHRVANQVCCAEVLAWVVPARIFIATYCFYVIFIFMTFLGSGVLGNFG